MPHASTMTAAQFRCLRQHAQLSVAEWAALLRCSPGAVKNMESKKPIGQQMALLAMILAHPEMRGRLDEMCAYAMHLFLPKEEEDER